MRLPAFNPPHSKMTATMNTDLRDFPGPVTNHLNRDPLTGTPGSHPVGTGIGAVAGDAAVGAAVGTVASAAF